MQQERDGMGWGWEVRESQLAFADSLSERLHQPGLDHREPGTPPVPTARQEPVLLKMLFLLH